MAPVSARTLLTMSPTWCGSMPPLVSHRTTTSAPASAAVRTTCSGVLGVVEVAVEEVLAVDEDALALAAQVLHGVAHHREVLLQRRAQRLLDVLVVALGDQRHDHGCVRITQRERPAGPRRPTAFGAPGRAERDERGVLEVELLGARAEELGVLRVRARPAALDVVRRRGRRGGCAMCSLSCTERLSPSCCAPSRIVVSKMWKSLTCWCPASLVCPSSVITLLANKKAPQTWRAARRVVLV